MAVLTLPVADNYPWYTFGCRLDGASYQLTMAFNTRANRWHLSLADAIGAPIVAAMPILVRRDLLAAYRHLSVPPGYLLAFDTSGQNREPQAESFLQDHVLTYVETGTF